MAVCVAGLSDAALPALLIFLIGYSAANLAAFAAICHLRGRTALADYAGLASVRSGAAVALIVSFLSLVGIPPLAGFVGKLTLFMAVIDGGYAWLAAVAVANTVVSLFYYLRIVAPICFGAAEARPPVLGRSTAAAVWLGLVLVAGFGLASEASFEAIGRTATFTGPVAR
jgi:NADH-quinone oxidoreductase subunit N